MATITLEGNEFHTNGDLPAVGSPAPDFHLVDGELGDRRLSDFAGKKKLLNIVPSLDTGVCAMSTKKFNEAASARKKDGVTGGAIPRRPKVAAYIATNGSAFALSSTASPSPCFNLLRSDDESDAANSSGGAGANMEV